jgi:hypothetical protein
VFLPPATNYDFNDSLKGSLPTELGVLTKLQRLYLRKCNEQVEMMNRIVSHFEFLPPDDNSLTGSLPTELGALSELEYLDLGTSHESIS